MEEVKQDEQEVQETPEEEQTEETQEEPEVDVDDLKRKAEASSQNYERAKKAEDKVKALSLEKEKLEAKLASSGEDIYGDTDDELKSQIADLNAKLLSMEEERQKDAVLGKYPILKDKYEEFDTYREENKGMSYETAAKAYLVENDLMGQKQRKGLEKAGGGKRTAPSSGKLSADDAARLRSTDFEGYRKALKEGRIEIE